MKVQLATRVEQKVKKAVERVCEENGFIMSRFIEDALLQRLEEVEDLQDLKRLRHESYRSFDEVASELRKQWKKSE